jgi:hypothetical protein
LYTCEEKFGLFLKAVWQHWWFLMASIFFAALRFIPAVKSGPLPQWVYWLGMSAGLFIACFLAWKDEYKKAESFKQEMDEMYADLVLDWFKNTSSTPAFFPSQFVAEKLSLDHEKVLRGVEVLEKELKVMRNDGPAGWFYNPIAAMRFTCGVRRLIPVKTIDAGTF